MVILRPIQRDNGCLCQLREQKIDKQASLLLDFKLKESALIHFYARFLFLLVANPLIYI